MANKKNGFEFIDLALPSGTLWAATNVGAQKPTEAGLYFQWGDTVGYKAEQVGKDKQFNQTDYKWHSDGEYTKYKTTGATLELADDAANRYMGGSWHIPTPEQIQELIDNTTSNWVKLDNVNGRLFTSKNGKSIFIPAVGLAYYGSIRNTEWYGYIWSSMLHGSSIDYGQFLYINSGSACLDCLDYYDRDFGMTVRGVIG